MILCHSESLNHLEFNKVITTFFKFVCVSLEDYLVNSFFCRCFSLPFVYFLTKHFDSHSNAESHYVTVLIMQKSNVCKAEVEVKQ